MKKSLFSLVAAAVAGIAMVACSNDKAAAENAAEETTAEETAAPEQYDAELVDVENTTIDTLANGTVQVENEVQLTPEQVAE